MFHTIEINTKETLKLIFHIKDLQMSKSSIFLGTIFLLVVLLITPFFVKSQSNGMVDSLIQLTTEQANDSSKLQTLVLITKELKSSDPIEALRYAEQSLELSNRLNLNSAKVDALFQKASIYKSIGMLDSAQYNSETAISLCKLINDKKRLADNLLIYASIIRNLGNTGQAFFNVKKSLKIYNQISDTSGIIKALNGLGIIYKIRGILDSAAFYYQESIRLCEKTGNMNKVSAAMINLGKIYLTLDDLENAKKFLEGSVSYAQEYNLLSHIVIAYTNLGIVAYNENQFDLALDYYNKALPISEQIQDMSGIANLYNNIGNIYFQEKMDFQNAYKYYNKSLDIFRQVGQKTGVLINLMNIAVIHDSWGNFERALMINDTCLQLAKETGSLSNQKTICQNIMSVYINLGNYKKAFEYQTKYYELNDSIFNIEKTEIIAELTLEYEKEKYQARILALENENLQKDLDLKKRTNQRNLYLFSGSGIIVVFLFFIIYFRQKVRKDQIIASQKIQQLEEEKRYLAASSIVEGQEDERRRIAAELHDGLGVLLSSAKLYFTSVKDKSPDSIPIIDKASKLLEKASQDVRRISHNMMPGILAKYGLFEAVANIFDEIEEIEDLNAEFNLLGNQKRFNENKEIMIYRVVQEMVNNSLKHANAKNVFLKMHIKLNLLLVDYSDDGKGFDVEEKLKLQSFGLNNIISRVKFLGGEVKINSELNKGVEYSFEISI